MKDILANERILNMMEQLLGSTEVLGHPVWNIRTKTPRSKAGELPWHQGKDCIGVTDFVFGSQNLCRNCSTCCVLQTMHIFRLMLMGLWFRRLGFLFLMQMKKTAACRCKCRQSSCAAKCWSGSFRSFDFFFCVEGFARRPKNWQDRRTPMLPRWHMVRHAHKRRNAEDPWYVISRQKTC